MRNGNPFFIGEETEEFQRPGRFQKRYIVPTPLTPSAKKPEPEELSISMIGRLRALSPKPEKWFGCCCIAVIPDDGMSWSAEAVARALACNFPSYAVLPLSRETATDSLPHIVQIIGERRVMKAAVRQKLANWYPTLYVSHAPLILMCIFLLGGLIAALQALLKLWTPNTLGQANQLWNIKLFVLAGSLAILAVIAKVVADKLSTGKKKASLDEFIEKLPGYENSPRQGLAVYWKFVGDLAKALEWVEKPRIVIVDNYESLDLTTKRALECYFQEHYQNAAGAEFWVIFESTDGPRFSEVVRESPNPYAQFSKEVSFFQQQLLTESALLKLNQLLGRDEAPQYSIVKSVVSGTAQQVERVVSAIKGFTEIHPRKENKSDQLEFFYFLSLAASPGSVQFSRNKLTSLLSKKKLERSEVLKKILAGSELNKGEFQEWVIAITQSFKEFVTCEQRAADTVVGFSSEVARILEEKAGELKLPDVALVHLFWALYWFEQAQKKFVDPYPLRKLSHHALQTTISAVLDCSLNRKFLSIVIYAISASMRSCLFKSLLPLLEKAFNVYDSLDAQQRRKAEGELVGLCWEVYSVSGDEMALAYLSKLQEAQTEEHVRSELQLVEGDLPELFVGSTVLDLGSRASLRRVFHGWLARKSDRQDANHESAKRNSYARAGWLLSCFIDLTTWVGVEGTLVANVGTDQDTLKLAFRETCDRIYDNKDSLPLFTDVMTLALSLWSCVLLARTSGDPASMDDVTNMVEEALIVAAKLKDRATASAEMELLLFALAREVCAVALGCLLVLYHRFYAVYSKVADRLKIRKLLGDGQALFKSGTTPGSSDGDFDFQRSVNEIDTLFAQCAFVWTRFDLDRLWNFAHLRRLQFNVICRNLAPDDQTRLLPLMQAAGRVVESGGYPGILGNCIFATCHRGAAELCAYFVLQAADCAIDNESSLPLQNELAMLAIARGHAFGIDLDRYLGIILEPGSGSKTPMRRFLGVVENAAFLRHALSYLNAAANVADASLAAKVWNTVQEVAGLLPPGPQQLEVEALIQYHVLNRRFLRDGTLPPAEQVLDQWKDRKHLWMYAGVLQMLIETGDPLKVRKEACALLHRDPSEEKFTSFFQLALAFGQHTGTSMDATERSALLGYLPKALRHWEASVSADSNVTAYRMLISLDRSSAPMYSPGLLKWEKIKIERDHLKRLRELVRNERYLLIFFHYFETALFWGLRTDVTEEEWRSFAQADFDQRKQTLKSWIADGAVVPQPIISKDGPVVSARFLWIGQYLFLPRSDKDPSFDDYRAAFNQAAKNSLPDLLTAILLLPGMPQELRFLLSDYSGGLLEEAGIRKKSAAARVA